MRKGTPLGRRAGVGLALLVALVAALLAGPPVSAVEQRTLHGTLHILKKGSGTGTVRGRPPVPDNIETQVNCGPVCVVSITDTTDPMYQPMTLTAIPDPGSVLKSWSGDCVGTATDCTMGPIGRLVNYYVTATFDQAPADAYPVAVSTNGEGKVVSSPAGIDCGASCAASFRTGSTVTLTAIPAAGWSFGGWGGACAGVGPCSLAIDGPKNVEATFTPPSFRLTVAAAGRGAVTSDPAGLSCGASCSALFPSGRAVTLRAIPEAGAQLAAWSGACSGAAPDCTVTMSQAVAVTATFSGAEGRPLAVATSGPGLVTGSAGGISCGAACSAVLPTGSTVRLTAVPGQGSRLAGWSGSCGGTAAVCTVAMGEARAVVARFQSAPSTYPLAVTASGKGIVRSAPAGILCKPTCTAPIRAGSSVVLTADPLPKWTFVRWTGACTSRAPTCKVTMKGPQTVTATFAPNADQAAPRVTALASTGQRGSIVRLRYRVTDDSGRSREWATVYQGSRRLGTVRGTLDEADPDALFYFLPWRAPRTVGPGELRFCVQAADPTGNVSPRSCAPLKLN